MKKEELFEITATLDTISVTKTTFLYAVNKNQKIIANEIILIRESFLKLPDELTDENKEYTTKKQELIEECGERDKDNNLILVGSNSYKIKDFKTFNLKFKELNENHAELLVELDKINVKNQELLDEETDIKFYKIKLENVPDGLTKKQVDALMYIIDDE